MSENTPIGPLFTDLYELTMAAGYFAQGFFFPATFSLFVRDLPPYRGYLVFVGLEEVLNELAAFRFSPADLAYLKETGLFAGDFLDYLESLRFDGQVVAMPEGSLFFENEPVLEVRAPVIQAQILETYLLNTIGFQSLLASKAARCVHAAGGRPLIDFALRRTQGKDAGMKFARSSYLAGFAGTSNVLAGKRYGIPISGTMAHSYVTAFESEQAAFEAYSRIFPHNTVLLIDTYDTLEGARIAARVGREMEKRNLALKGVRLDSGDMNRLSQAVRAILDEAGLDYVQIFASSGFDEFSIADILAQGARIDAFGVGTQVGVSADAPSLNIVYKMVRCRERDVRKLSPGKVSLAGEKQVFRRQDANGRYQEDIIGLRSESIPGTTPLLETVMEKGQFRGSLPSLATLKARFSENFQALGEPYKSLTPKTAYPVGISQKLKALQAAPG